MNEIKSLRAWDRQTRRMIPLTDYHYNEAQDREYFKIKGCSVWLEDGVALDIFYVGDNNALIKRHSIHTNNETKND